jgi:hypothetical protein
MLISKARAKVVLCDFLKVPDRLSTLERPVSTHNGNITKEQSTTSADPFSELFAFH